MLRKKGRMNFSVQLAVSVMKWQQGAQSLVAVINMQINCCGIMKWPNFPHNQSLLIRKLPQASYPHPSEGRQTENHNHRKLTNLITWTQPCLTQWNHEPMLCRATQDGWIMVENSEKNVVHWRREWQVTSVFLPWEPHEQYEKGKSYDTEGWTPQVGRCPICYWRSLEK